MKKRVKQAVACLLLAVAACLVAIGLADGGFSDVAEKARVICYECIGVG
ncbi:MAG: hypothetical protein IK118_04020 [Clostridia bacterium]|nr:hypothetical protein [Clostridia bacterium]MBR5427490.1 hypothetical protein [Clostridia bacterium]